MQRRRKMGECKWKANVLLDRKWAGRNVGAVVAIMYGVRPAAGRHRLRVHGPARDARTKSVKYLRNAFGSSSRILVANSAAVAGGQFCEGRKTDTRKSKASCPLIFETVCRKLAISWRTYK